MQWKRIKSKLSNVYIKTFLIVLSIMLFLFIIKKYAPFGQNSLATMDAKIQYLDFFMYLKDVLSGENSVNYSFSSGLGQNTIAVLSYYLLSPLNIFVIFFDKTNIESFFNLIVLLKVSIAGVTFTYFLKNRFKNSITNFYIILLSIGYALCQYNIAQASNIMWLDGVYMLPLILLGVYKIVNNKGNIFLILSIVCSLIFNWYTGLLNCLFSIIWFLFETAIFEIDSKEQIKFKEKLKIISNKFLKYSLSGILACLISAFVLIPTFISLQSGRGNLQFGLLKDFSIIGDIPSVISQYTIGATSQYGKVSLFCGSFALIGCISSIFLNKISKKKRILFTIFLIFILLMFYWNPLFVIFSLIKSASSYWYRYSYLGIFGILFLAAYFYQNKTDYKYFSSIIKTISLYSILLMILNTIFKTNTRNNIYLTIAFIISVGLMYIFINYINDKKRILQNISKAILLILVIVEITFNSSLLMDKYHTTTVDDVSTYIEGQEEQIAEINNRDSSYYRISQTKTRNMNKETNLTANYNEPLAFNYWGISSYTSDPNEIQRQFLSNLGYKSNGANTNIINTSILGADSLLGIKYILSNYPINGLNETKIETKNSKKVYENPYVLPFAFKYDNVSILVEDNGNNNPFEYQNCLFSNLLNEDVKLYVPVEFTKTDKYENGKNIITYKLNISEGKYAIYGNLVSSNSNTSILNINNKYQTDYFCWLSPSVFYIPTSGKTEIVNVTLSSKEKNNIKQEQFYALQLDVLKEISNKINEKKANIIYMQNGKVHIEVNSNIEKEKLFVSIPYDEGWEVLLNGTKIIPEIYANCMMVIPLENGNNVIDMKYDLPYFKISLVISIIGLFIFIVLVIYSKKIKNNKIFK